MKLTFGLNKVLADGDKTPLSETGLQDGDNIHATILKNGNENIPGYVTAEDLYSALGDRMKDAIRTGGETSRINIYYKFINS